MIIEKVIVEYIWEEEDFSRQCLKILKDFNSILLENNDDFIKHSEYMTLINCGPMGNNINTEKQGSRFNPFTSSADEIASSRKRITCKL